MIKVLIVDDSMVACGIVKQMLGTSDKFEVVGVAHDGKESIIKTKETKPDVIIMDINMPEMDGLEATRIIMKECPTAILVFTTEDVARVGYTAIEAGAVDILPKPDFDLKDDRFTQLFLHKIESASKALLERKFDNGVLEVSEKTDQKFKIVCIGTSTGGPVAVQNLLKDFPEDFPIPILITQHIEVGFDSHYVSWLSSCCKLKVSLAVDGEVPQPGHIYVAPADKHLTMSPAASGCVLRLSDEPPVFFLRPAVDIMFKSAAQVFKQDCLAVLLTGMGKDGGEGAKSIKDAGGFVICESEETCVVYGMSRAAIEAGAASRILPLDKIGKLILSIAQN